MPAFSYRTAATSVKLAVTAWLLLAVVAIGVAGLQIHVQAGLTPTRALQHYRGDEATLQYPMNFANLVGITHAHAFTLPMLALILSLGMIASSAREGLKRTLVTPPSSSGCFWSSACRGSPDMVLRGRFIYFHSLAF